MVADALPSAIQRDAARVADGLVVDVLSADQLDLAATTWRALEASVDVGVADSWDWIETWLDHYGDMSRHHFAIGRGPDGPRGIALLVEGVDQRRGPLPVRTLHIGTAGEPDAETVRVQYNRPLVAPADRAEFAAALLRAVDRVEFPYDEIVIDGFTPNDMDPFLDAKPAFRTTTLVCHVTDLRAVRAEGKPVLSAFRSGTGKKLRRSHRRLEEAFGPIRVECAETLEQAESIYNELIVLHQQRWESAGEPGRFASRRFTEFHRDLIRKLFPRGRILMVRVTAGDVTVGCDYNLLEHRRAMAYQWGLGHFEDTLISPGIVTSIAVMQTAMERGLDEYDWLGGDVFYKRQLATVTRELVWARLPHGVRGHLVDYALRARRYSKQKMQERRGSSEGEGSEE